MKRFHFTLQIKTALGSLMLALLLSVSICAASYVSYRSSLIDRYTTVAAQSAVLARRHVNGDHAAGYLESLRKDDEYYLMQESFNEIKGAFNLMYLYMHIPADGKMNYIIDAYVEDDDPDDISDLGGSDFLGEESWNTVINLYQNGPAEGVILFTDEGYGYLATALLPVYDSGGRITALIGADISMDMVNTKLNSYILRIALITLFIVFGFILLMLAVVRRSIIRPLHLLADAAEGAASGGDTLFFANVNIRSRDELYTLASAFNRMAEDISLHISNVKRVTAENERIGAELSIAKSIQASMLPCIFPPYPDREEFDIYACMQPAKEVGGDFYDFFLINDNTLAVVMADVSGKGVPAALFMVIAKTLIKNNAQSGKSPKEVFETVNNLLCENNEAGMFVTAFMGYFDISVGRLTFVNAGHNPPLLSSGGKFDWLKTKRGLVLAGMEDMRYTQSEVFLKPGDELFLYTDGVTEAVNNDNKLFGDTRLLAVADNNIDLSLREFVSEIRLGVDKFAEGAEQADDITMLALRYKHNGGFI